MKRILSYITILALAAAVPAGCIDSYIDTATDGGSGEGAGEGKGSLVVGVTFDGREAGLKSRAGESDGAAAPTDCVVKIDNRKAYLYIYESLAAIPDKLWLTSNTYNISVEGGIALPKANVEDDTEFARYGWDTPYYAGNKEFTISKGSEERVTVDGVLQSTLFTVAFDGTIDTYFSDYTLRISVSGQELVFDADNIGAVGYVVLGERTAVNWAFAGTLKLGGGQVAKSGTLEDAAARMRYDMSFEYSTGLLGGIVFTVNENVVKETHPIKIPAVAESTVLAPESRGDIWATHAKVSGNVVEDEPATVEFVYRPVGGEEWQSKQVPPAGKGKYTTTLTGLAPGTVYEVALRIDGEIQAGDPVTFTTEAAAQLPNGGFEDWHQSGNTWNPYASGAVPFWGTGNPGSAEVPVFGTNVTTSANDPRPNSPGSKSVLMTSKYIVVQFAAGNIYSGSFAGTEGTDGNVDFGRPFTSRPSALKGWYKASPGTVNRGKSDPPLANGKADEYQIYICLTDWDGPRRVFTGNHSTFMKFDPDPASENHDPKIIAFGEITGNTAVGWTEFKIDLKYRDTTRIPKYIVVVACASRYGDYFNGSDSSTMYVDDFELIYDENIVLQ